MPIGRALSGRKNRGSKKRTARSGKQKVHDLALKRARREARMKERASGVAAKPDLKMAARQAQFACETKPPYRPRRVALQVVMPVESVDELAAVGT